MVKVLVCGSMLGVAAVAVGACAGDIGSTAESVTVGERAAVVAEKRAWLEGYDRHCDACFVAFDLCEKGAESDDQLVACQVALDACVRGGLLGRDGGRDGADAGDESDAGADADGGLANDVDADVDEDDAGEDADEDADEGAEEDVDGGIANDDDADDEKGVLNEAVGACLGEARACVESSDADGRACLSDLRSCVKEVLTGSFDSTCSQQIRACRDEGRSRDQVQSVERQCRTRPSL